MKTDSNNFLMIVAVVAVSFAMFNLAVTVNKVGDMKNALTGFALEGIQLAPSDQGPVDVVVESSASVEFLTTNNALDWGSGFVSGGTFATLETEAPFLTNWVENLAPSTVTEGLILRNIGNVDVTLDLSSSNDAAGFIGGTHDNLYQWKLSEYTAGGDVAGACGGTGLIDIVYTDVALTALPRQVCPQFNWEDTTDEILIDVHVNVPDDANSGAKSSVITAAATAI